MVKGKFSLSGRRASLIYAFPLKSHSSPLMVGSVWGVVSTSGGRLDCAEIVIQTLSTNEPKVILPCNGDRVFGMAQDNEMAFAFPWAYAQEIVEGLEGTHKGGTRYPITVAMRDTVTMPKSYQDLMKMLVDREATAANKRD